MASSAIAPTRAPPTYQRKAELHCNGNSFYIFLFWEERGPSPNIHIHVSLSDLYIPRISLHISSSRTGRPIVGIYNSLTDTWMWELGLRPRYSFSGNICFKFSAFYLCSVRMRLAATLVQFACMSWQPLPAQSIQHAERTIIIII